MKSSTWSWRQEGQVFSHPCYNTELDRGQPGLPDVLCQKKRRKAGVGRRRGGGGLRSMDCGDLVSDCWLESYWDLRFFKDLKDADLFLK